MKYVVYLACYVVTCLFDIALIVIIHIVIGIVTGIVTVASL